MALRNLRNRAGVSLAKAAGQVGYSEGWLSRVERGEAKPRRVAITGLLRVFGVKEDSQEWKDLLKVAEQAAEPGWWERLEARLPDLISYISFEDEAVTIRAFQSSLIPGLLQTEDYARAVISLNQQRKPEEVEELVAARLRRQEILERPSPPTFTAVIGEAALHIAAAGDADLMRVQFAHVVKMARRPNITLQVLPFSAGAPAAANSGPFTLLDFDGVPPMAYCETPAGAVFVVGPGEFSQLHDDFNRVLALATNATDTVRWFGKLAKGQ